MYVTMSVSSSRCLFADALLARRSTLAFLSQTIAKYASHTVIGTVKK